MHINDILHRLIKVQYRETYICYIYDHLTLQIWYITGHISIWSVFIRELWFVEHRHFNMYHGTCTTIKNILCTGRALQDFHHLAQQQAEHGIHENQLFSHVKCVKWLVHATVHVTVWFNSYHYDKGPLLLTWNNVGWNYLSIPKLLKFVNG